MTAEAGVTQCLSGPQAWGMQQPLEAEKGKEMDFPLELLEGKCSGDTLILGCGNSDLQNSNKLVLF